MTLSPAAMLCLNATLAPVEGNDSPGFIRTIGFGLLGALHEALLARQVCYILTNETTWLGEVDSKLSELDTELGVDTLSIYLPIGSKPGIAIDTADISKMVSMVETVFNLTGSILTLLDIILNLEIKIPLTGVGTNYLYFWDGASMTQGIDFDPDRYMTVRDLYTYIIIKRIISFVIKNRLLGAAAAGSLASALLKGWTSKTRTDVIKDTTLPPIQVDTTAIIAQNASILSRIGDPGVEDLTSKLDEILDVPAETQLLISRLKLFFL